MQKTKGDTFDLRAEEDAARRLNVGKITANASLSGLNSRAKRTDLIGKTALQERVEAIAKDHGISCDTEASLYLLSAIEERLRSLLSSSITAQTHRTNASYLYPAPVHHGGRSADGKGKAKRSNGEEDPKGKALWSHRITSDSNAVIDALNRQNKEFEQAFRLSRMERLAQEASLQKARERAAEMEAGGSGQVVDLGGIGGGGGEAFDPSGLGGGGGGGGPSTPMKSSSPASSSSTPMFGAVRETPKGSTKKSARKIALDTSADVQFKMTNATAMQNAGIKSRKYGWMMGNAPAVSSPLAAGAKKRKAEKEKEKEKEKNKDKEGSLAPSASAGEDGGEGDGGGEREESRPSKRLKSKSKAKTKTKEQALPLSAPTRRLVTISKDEKGQETRVNDDRVLTMVDVVFALEHGGLGAGSLGGNQGEVGDVLRRIWARAGGPWGKDGWGEKK